MRYAKKLLFNEESERLGREIALYVDGLMREAPSVLRIALGLDGERVSKRAVELLESRDTCVLYKLNHLRPSEDDIRARLTAYVLTHYKELKNGH